MKYFDTLPNVLVTQDNVVQVMKNLMIRTSLVDQLSKNDLLFYKYAIQDGDTPEIIADKYYGDSYRYWMVLYGNPKIMHPQWDWPLTSNQFTTYIQEKYKDIANGVDNVLSYTQGTPHHYEKLVTTIDNETGTTAVKTVEIDHDTYVALDTFTQTQTFADGSSVSYSVSKNVVSIYDYELNLNEEKRNIDIINSRYATQLETQFKNLVNP